MSLIYMIVIGFIVGLIARFLKPGRQEMGFVMTTLLGIGGALIGGFIGRGIGFYQMGEPAGIIGSIIGAFLLLVIIQALFSKRTA